MALAVRIPSWSKTFKISKNGTEIGSQDLKLQNGYAYIDISTGDKIKLELNSNPYIVYPSAKIPDLSGNISICRGPLVYCAEGVDNEKEITGLFILKNNEIKIQDPQNGITTLLVAGLRQEEAEELYLDSEPNFKNVNIIMRPYYSWANRGLTQMKVWFPSK